MTWREFKIEVDQLLEKYNISQDTEVFNISVSTAYDPELPRGYIPPTGIYYDKKYGIRISK